MEINPEILLDLPEQHFSHEQNELSSFLRWGREKIQCPRLKKLVFLVYKLFLEGKNCGGINSVDPFQRINEEKFKSFFHKLQKTTIQFTKPLIKNPRFLKCFVALCRAIRGDRVSRKIEYYARILEASASNEGNKICGIDEFENNLELLKELSFEEVQFLFILDRYQENNPVIKGERKVENIEKYWPSFKRAVQNKFRLSEIAFENHLEHLLNLRCIKRTGCGRVRLSDSFYIFKNLIQLQNRLI
ncbi:hypothetical protein ACFL35_07995 [Candidatus Riflebacteria bacterium]